MFMHWVIWNIDQTILLNQHSVILKLKIEVKNSRKTRSRSFTMVHRPGKDDNLIPGSPRMEKAHWVDEEPRGPQMKKWASEDDLLFRTQRSKDVREYVDFWDLLYPQHPIIRLRPIAGSPSDEVLCLGCGRVHNHHVICTDQGPSENESHPKRSQG